MLYIFKEHTVNNISMVFWICISCHFIKFKNFEYEMKVMGAIRLVLVQFRDAFLFAMELSSIYARKPKYFCLPNTVIFYFFGSLFAGGYCTLPTFPQGHSSLLPLPLLPLLLHTPLSYPFLTPTTNKPYLFIRQSYRISTYISIKLSKWVAGKPNTFFG